MSEPAQGGPDMTLPRVGKRGAPQAFARKLYEILTTESPSVICWNKGGTAFHVKNVDTFSEEILTKYYRHSKFSSFQRQLNLYSFRKIVKGPDSGGYAHPMFHRDRPDDLYHVRRSISGSGRYESTTHVTSPSTASAAARRSHGGRMSGRANNRAGTDSLECRVYKSKASIRRTGKLRNAIASPRRDTAGDIPSGERSPWTTGESNSDSDSSSDAGTEDDSDFECGRDQETLGDLQPGLSERVTSARSGESGDEAGHPSPFSNTTTAETATHDNSVSEKATEKAAETDRKTMDKGGNEEARDAQVSTSHSRVSPFRIFRGFSFMDKSHARGINASSVDLPASSENSTRSPESPSVEASAEAEASVLECETASTSDVVSESNPEKDTAAEGPNKDKEAASAMPPPPKREPPQELGLVEQLTNMVEVFDICDLLRRVSNSSRGEKSGQGSAKPSQHLRNMSIDTDSGVPTSPQSRDSSNLPSLASMELTRDSSRDWDALMAGSAEMSDLGSTMVQSVAEFFSF